MLIGLMRQYEAAVGCVAWLTHFDILDAMARLKTVSIVVQKEDFLRPDMGQPSNWKDLLSGNIMLFRKISVYATRIALLGVCLIAVIRLCRACVVSGITISIRTPHSACTS